MSEHHLIRCPDCGDLARQFRTGHCTECARRAHRDRTIIRWTHRLAGWLFWPALAAATFAVDSLGVAFETAITLAALAGWLGVVWLLTNPALDRKKEEQKENGQ